MFQSTIRFCVAAALLSVIACAKVTPQTPATSLPANSFDKIKGLAGKWETAKDAKGKKEVVVYKVTSGGSAVEERLFPGTKEEMVSIYHKTSDGIGMTHYCMLGNAPEFKASSPAANVLAFNFQDTKGIDAAHDAHMNQLTVTFKDKNHIRQEWNCANHKEFKEPKVIELHRVK